MSMGQRRFDEASLVKRLAGMPAVSRVAFALCCATRQLEAYEQFAERFAPESKGSARSVIDQLWDVVASSHFEKVSWDVVLGEVMELLPEEQEQWAPFHVYADHAISSLAYTIRCLQKADAQEAAWSARRAYEAADQAAIRDLGVQTGIVDPEARILAHPLVQQELERQERDLRLLQSGPSKQILDVMKTSSLNESMLNLSEMSR